MNYTGDELADVRAVLNEGAAVAAAHPLDENDLQALHRARAYVCMAGAGWASVSMGAKLYEGLCVASSIVAEHRQGAIARAANRIREGCRT